MNKKTTFAAIVGTILEFYDYTLLSLFLPLIAPLFFPAEDAFSALMMGYGMLMVSVITRPLGGLFFGYIGDKHGRKKALTLSILLMAVPTLLTGLIPPYAVIGIYAPLLMGVLKSLQALCCGGEYSGAGLFVVEHAKKSEKGKQSGLLVAANLGGCFLASVIGLIFTLKAMPEWGWRVPFILGGLLGIAGIYYRRSLKESPEFLQNLEKQGKFQSMNLKIFFKKNKARILCAIGIGGSATVPFTIVNTFMLPVMKVKDVISTTEMMLLSCTYMLFCMVCLYISGKLSDIFSQKKIMTIGASGLIIISLPALYAFNHLNIFYVIPFHLALLLLNEMFLGPSNAFLCRLFPVHYRYRGISFSFCLGLVIFGAPTPFICTKLTQVLNFGYLPAFWLMFVGALSYIAVWYGEILIQNTPTQTNPLEYRYIA